MSEQSTNREIAIKLSSVKKQYKLGQIGGGTLTADLQSWWARRRGKEDPNTKIGQDQRLIGQTFMALNGIDLTVYKGEALGIIGGNGAGKSTMLKLLSRVTAPTEGEIDIYGRITSMLEVGTGFNGELTGRENVYMNGAILGMTKAEIDAKMEDIIEFSEVREFIDTPVKRYSSGMYVKLAFSIAAHLDSEIMIMDEVLAVGDMAFQKKCLDKMREVAKKEGRTVLYVSHNMNTIRQLCDRCVVLEQGKVVFEGNVEEAITIYLNKTDDEFSCLNDLSKRDRPKSSTNKAFMQQIAFLNKTKAVCTRGEFLKIKLDWIAKANLSDVKFRMIVRYRDDSPVGLVQSESLGNFSVDETQITNLEFDTSMLAEGKYFFSIALFQSDEVGNSVILDHVTRACSIEILNNTEDKKILNWEHRWWGSIRFPSLKILNQGFIKDGNH
ncbi:MAG: ATP-binding cassette domain-containing protein [Clostridia bacterium]|nr:ATP-binding cassette domain-containing protein [Clostridia bacterium]